MSDLSARLDAIARAKTINGINYALNKNSRWERVKSGVAHGAVHLSENVAAWKVGKVVGGAIGQVAASHGADPEVARLLGETAVQALASTALYARGSKRSGTDIATHLIAQSAAAFSGKISHTGVDDLSEMLGGSERVTAISALVAGKMAGIGTVVAAHKSGVARKLAESLPAAITRIGSLIGGDAILERSGQRRTANARGDSNSRKSLNLAEVDNAAEMVMMGYAIAALDKYRGDSMSLALDLLRFDLARMDKGQGKPCGKGFISARKKCSEKGLKQLTADLKAGDEGAKRRVQRGKELAKSRQELTRQVQADKGKKARDKIVPDSPEVASARKILADSQRDLDLAGRVYGNTNAKLSGEEYKLARKLGFDTGVTYKRLEKIRQQEFEARQRLKDLTGEKDEAPKQKAQSVAKGPMSESEANAPLSANDRQQLKTVLGSQQNAVSTLQKLRAKGGAEFRRIGVEDVQAIQSYTGDGYIGMNGAMRGLQSDPNSSLSKGQRLAARATQQAIQKLPKYEGEVRRDTRLSAEEIKRDFKVGGVVSFKGLTSTSADKSGNAASEYGSQNALTKASNYGEKAAKAGLKTPASDAEQVEFRIKAKSGRDISPFSTRPHEQEILLPHGWKGKVSQIETVKGRTVIHMEEHD